MSKYLFNPKDITKLTNLHKKLVRPINKKDLEKLQKLNPELYKTNDDTTFSYPEFPSNETLNSIMEIAFLATLKKVEGRFHKFLIAIPPLKDGLVRDINPDVIPQHYNFLQPLDYNVENIIKLSTALDETENIINVVFDDQGNPKISGFCDNWKNSLIIESIDVGKLLFSVFFVGKFSIAIIEGRDIRFFRSEFSSFDLAFSKLHSLSLLNEVESANAEQEIMGDYRLIMEKMNAHKHGGTLIFVLDKSWKKSIQFPIQFSPKVEYNELSKWIIRRNDYWEKFQDREDIPVENSIASDRVEKCIKLLCQLTALDGATIITRDFEILAFGAKIKSINTRKKPDEVVISEPFENSVERNVKFENIGGTRHQSSAQFIFDQKQSVAIVASQDGKISIMFWDNEIKKVRISQHAEYSLI